MLEIFELRDRCGAATETFLQDVAGASATLIGLRHRGPMRSACFERPAPGAKTPGAVLSLRE
jgi:hypothetical protein